MGSAVDYKHWGGGDWQSSRADQKTGALKKEHDDAGGGHAHSGCAIYQGENFPAEYRNTLFTCNIHGNRLNNDGLERTAAGMKGVRRPDFAFANDPWFRGICVKQGPEGALYVSDWSDTGECHNYQVVDATNGRIFRIAYERREAVDGGREQYDGNEETGRRPSSARTNGWHAKREANSPGACRSRGNPLIGTLWHAIMEAVERNRTKPISTDPTCAKYGRLLRSAGLTAERYAKLTTLDGTTITAIGWLLRLGSRGGYRAGVQGLSPRQLEESSRIVGRTASNSLRYFTKLPSETQRK